MLYVLKKYTAKCAFLFFLLNITYWGHALKIEIGKSLTIICNRPLAHTAWHQYVVNPVNGAWISIQPFLCASTCLALIYDSPCGCHGAFCGKINIRIHSRIDLLIHNWHISKRIIP